MSRPGMGPTSSVAVEVKQFWCESDNSPESIVEVKKSGALHVHPLDVFMADRGTTIL